MEERRKLTVKYLRKIKYGTSWKPSFSCATDISVVQLNSPVTQGVNYSERRSRERRIEHDHHWIRLTSWNKTQALSDKWNETLETLERNRAVSPQQGGEGVLVWSGIIKDELLDFCWAEDGLSSTAKSVSSSWKRLSSSGGTGRSLKHSGHEIHPK